MLSSLATVKLSLEMECDAACSDTADRTKSLPTNQRRRGGGEPSTEEQLSCKLCPSLSVWFCGSPEIFGEFGGSERKRRENV